ncbi:hypothetical protein V8E55_007967 [Tylopilus felleus]
MTFARCPTPRLSHEQAVQGKQVMLCAHSIWQSTWVRSLDDHGVVYDSSDGVPPLRCLHLHYYRGLQAVRVRLWVILGQPVFTPHGPRDGHRTRVKGCRIGGRRWNVTRDLCSTPPASGWWLQIGRRLARNGSSEVGLSSTGTAALARTRVALGYGCGSKDNPREVQHHRSKTSHNLLTVRRRAKTLLGIILYLGRREQGFVIRKAAERRTSRERSAWQIFYLPTRVCSKHKPNLQLNHNHQYDNIILDIPASAHIDTVFQSVLDLVSWFRNTLGFTQHRFVTSDPLVLRPGSKFVNIRHASATRWCRRNVKRGIPAPSAFEQPDLSAYNAFKKPAAPSYRHTSAMRTRLRPMKRTVIRGIRDGRAPATYTTSHMTGRSQVHWIFCPINTEAHVMSPGCPISRESLKPTCSTSESAILHSSHDYDPASRKDEVIPMSVLLLSIAVPAVRPDVAVTVGAFFVPPDASGEI